MTHSADNHREYAIIRSISWELLIDPIADASEPDSYWYDDSECVDESPELVSIPLRKNIHSDHHSDESSMETHPSFPNPEYLNRMIDKK